MDRTGVMLGKEMVNVRALRLRSNEKRAVLRLSEGIIQEVLRNLVINKGEQ